MDHPECFGCGASIPGGLRILGQYLCQDCESKLIKCKTGKIDYQHWIDSCRRFWEKTGIKLDEFEE